MREFAGSTVLHMDCRACNGTYVSWDSRMLAQLPDGVRAHFPVVLTRKYACDQAMLSLLRSRTLGNSPSAFQHNMQEVHSEKWLRRQLCYLTDCERHKKGMLGLRLQVPEYREAIPFPPFPSPRWFLAAYVRDVWSRLPALLAAATSVYGSILKIDSTKKICKKLQGSAANTTSWATNVGNERGEVVVSVLTESEGCESLQRMAEGLVRRYEKARQEPPQLLYTDRDCCSPSGPSKYQLLFSPWDGIAVRLDVWHFMRRLSRGCTSESHPLFGVFMVRLSRSIFEWDERDLELLMSAKRGELVQAGVPNPSPSAVKKALSREETARYCRRRTRGAEMTTELIEGLLLAMTSATDTLGVPLFREEMKEVWEEQRHHIPCLQDPLNVPLYTITGHLTKGGVRLPLLRCARGSTSLESFHLHLARFIPGTSASAVNYQAYLLDGITRWNTSRAAAAINSPSETLRTFDARLKQKINDLSESVHGKKIFPNHQPSPEYSGELFGVEYLYSQSGISFRPKDDDLDTQIGEGFADIDEMLADGPDMPSDTDDITVAPLSDAESEDEDETQEETNDDELWTPGASRAGIRWMTWPRLLSVSVG